jgi:hypothetical protein
MRIHPRRPHNRPRYSTCSVPACVRCRGSIPGARLSAAPGRVVAGGPPRVDITEYQPQPDLSTQRHELHGAARAMHFR